MFGSMVKGRKITIKHMSRGNISLYHADVLCPDLFSTPFADLIVTSPPYNLNIKYDGTNDAQPYDDYLSFSRKWMTNCYEWAKPECRFVLNVPVDINKPVHRPIGAILTNLAMEIGWTYYSTIIWNKNVISNRLAWGSWKSASAPCVISPVELLLVFYKEQWKKTGGSLTSDISREEFMAWTNGLWTIAPERKSRIGHPAPFPRELPRRCIKLFSYVGDTVFEPFVGSGTTLIEAQLNNRIGVGLEKSAEYCDLAKKRINEECFLKKAA
jgi:site-specific DNA-methyltransferase (adenine-specific)